MSYNTKEMLTDLNGDLIPQYFDVTTDAFRPLTQDLNAIKLVGLGDLAVNTITVNTTEVLVKSGDSNLANRRKLILKVAGDDAVFIGKSGVTTTTGFPILPNQQIELQLDPTVNVDIHAIAGSDQKLSIIETN